MYEPDVSLLAGPSPEAAALEMVERKGLGHPDTLCDALAEQLSIGLSRHYLERFGAILHHNVDKALLVGGAARPGFGGGAVLRPFEIILAGRATRRFRGVEVPVDQLAVELSRAWLAQHLRHVDPLRHVRIVPRIAETSPDLAALFVRQGEAGVPLANDTSFGVGFAPLDRLERAVLAVEPALATARRRHPEIGEDLKVLGVRRGEAMQLLVACAFVDRHVRDAADYFTKKDRVRTLARNAAHEASGMQAEVAVNGADGSAEESLYITVTGLSAEAGDDGQVGRGNRVNGLITPYRPMSLEAAAGKNPRTHTGKLYNLLAHRIAHAIIENVAGVEEAHCFLLSRIGTPITEPQAAELRLRLADPDSFVSIRSAAVGIARERVAQAGTLWQQVLAGDCPVC